MAYTVKNIDDRTWGLTGSEGANIYLIAGDERAILIDSGFGDEEHKEIVNQLTSLPVTLVLSHGHGDHVSGAKYWKKALINEADKDLFDKYYTGDGIELSFLSDGEILDLGNRKIKVIFTPGHSKGGTVFLDEENQYLFSADTVMNQPVFLQFAYSSVDEYINSIKKLYEQKDKISKIFPGHRNYPLGNEVLDDFLESGEKAARGDEAEVFEIDLGIMNTHNKGYLTNGYGFVIENLDGIEIPLT